MRDLSKRTLAFVFAGLLALLIILVGATMGIGALSVPDGAVAFVEDVDDGEISQDDLDVAVEQAASAEGGGAEVPEEGTPQYNAALVPALSDLLLGRWVRGEAEERDISVTEREVDVELQTIIEEQFGGEKEFERFLDQSGFSQEDALDRVELQLLTQCIQDQVIPQDPEAAEPQAAREGCQGNEEVEITDGEIQKFYDDNITQFETPETRDVRTLLNPDEEKAQEAADQLAEDNSAESWKKVTKELSTEEETKDLGGLRPGVQAGQNEPTLDEAIFSAAEGEVVGPIEVEDVGFYVIQVDAINEAATQPLDENTTAQIRQQLVTQEQQAAVTEFQDEFVAKWRARTACSEDLLADDKDGTLETQLAERCSNFKVTDDGCLGDDASDELQPDPVTGEVPEEPTGCGVFVPLWPVIPPIPLPQDEEDPLLATPGAELTPLPQGPQPPPADEEEALPPGTLPPGAQQLPPGTAPPGTAPPGTVPPTGGTTPPPTAQP